MVDYSVHVGVYLRVKVPTTTEIHDMCAKHNRPDDATFCPFCGRTKKDRFETRVIRADRDWWHEPQNVDRLHEPDDLLTEGEGYEVTILLSNKGAGGYSLSREGGSGVHMITDRTLDEAAFLGEHAREIEGLRAIGCEVSIEWGVVSFSY